MAAKHPSEGHRERLRRFEKTGFDGFAEHEVVELTLRLVDAANALGIRVADHFIITADGALNFRRNGLLAR